MRKYDWLEDRIDIIGVKLYSFREHDFETIGHQPAERNPTRLQMFNQLKKTIEFRNGLNEVIENLEKLLDGENNGNS
jgi:hypothetical protein